MKKSDLRTADYIEHMLEAIGRIREYVAPLSLETFESTRMAVDAVIRNLEIIGEAAHNVMLDDPAFVTAHPEIPWQDVYAMRNRVSHGYFSINLKVVWVTIQRDLPELERKLVDLNPA
jgi:uncharacterized protein with HEPN domain